MVVGGGAKIMDCHGKIGNFNIFGYGQMSKQLSLEE
jgi:hypothetical protein